MVKLSEKRHLFHIHEKSLECQHYVTVMHAFNIYITGMSIDREYFHFSVGDNLLFPVLLT